jgi:hypothetical protein
MVCLDTSVPYTSARCACTSPVVNPLAVNETTMSSTPDSRRCRLRTIFGSNVEARSRGTSICTGPTSVSTVLALLPLGELSVPARSCGS